MDRLIDIIKMFMNVPVLDDPNTTMPQRKNQPVVGTLAHNVRQLNREREGKLEEFNMGCRKGWERWDVSGEAATDKTCSIWGNRNLTKSGSRRGSRTARTTMLTQRVKRRICDGLVD